MYANSSNTVHSKNSTWLVGFVGVVDVLIIISTGLLSHLFRFKSWSDGSDSYYMLASVTIVVVHLLHLQNSYLFHVLARPFSQWKKVAVAWSAAFMIMVVFGFITKTSSDVSRLWVGLWFVSGLVSLALSRLLWFYNAKRMLKNPQYWRNVIIIGSDLNVILRHLQGRAGAGVNLIGIFTSNPGDDQAEVAGVQVTGDVAIAGRFARENRVDDVLVAMPWTDAAAIKNILQVLRPFALNVHLLPPPVMLEFPNCTSSYFFGVWALNLMSKPLSERALLAKRGEDIVLGAFLLIIFSPIMALVALAIKLDSPGPLLFCQERGGFNNSRFRIYKFRTMYHQPAESDVPQAKKCDPRVTRVGRILRRISFDEFPQLFNVLRGEMSIVGPRPHAVSHNLKFAAEIEEYLTRCRIKPGMTGWAQVNGYRGETDTIEKMRMRVEYDVFYIENWSLFFDMKIVVQTIFHMHAPNAY